MTRECSQTSDRADRIRAEHRAVLASMRGALWHALACGDLLQQEKNEAGHGNWLPWLAEHYPEIPERAASQYMRLARHRAEIEKLKSADLADLTITGALAGPGKRPSAPRFGHSSRLPDKHFSLPCHILVLIRS
jgi:hypothetical protein